jgi:hypothetical protein
MHYLKNLIIILFSISILASNISVGIAADDKAYRNFANQIVAEFNQRNTVTFNEAFDVDAFMKEVFKDLNVKTEQKKAFKKGFAAQADKIGAKLIEFIPEDRYIKLLRVTVEEGGAKAVLRLDFGNNGTGYFEFIFKQLNDDRIKIIDWYDFGTGMKYSESVRQILILTLNDLSLLSRVFNIVKGQKNILENLQALLRERQRGNYEKVCSLYNSLDHDLRRNKVLALFNLDAANLSDNQQLYKDALRNFVEYFGNDPTCSFLLVDHYYLEKKYSKAIDSIDTFIAFIGIEDAALLSIKASVMLEQNRANQSVLFAEKGIRTEAEYEDNYWAALLGYARLNEYSKAVEMCRALENKFSYDFPMEYFQKNEIFQGLIKSKSFIAWMNSKQNG